MNYLIDTCCISELVKSRPSEKVIRWFTDHDELKMYLSVITFGEIQKGIEKLPPSARRSRIERWVGNDLRERFKNRILDITLRETELWGKVLATSQAEGNPLPALDALIAATALSHNLSVVTRNISDMQASGVDLVNPWN